MFYIFLAIILISITIAMVFIINNITKNKSPKYKYAKYLMPVICSGYAIKYVIDYIVWPKDAIGTFVIKFNNLVFISSHLIAAISCLVLCILIDKGIILGKSKTKAKKKTTPKKKK